MIDANLLKSIEGRWYLDGKPYTGISKAVEATYHYRHGLYHRGCGLPAVEWEDGSEWWYVDGKRHRDNGLPAIEWVDGDKSWWVNGRLHRDDGLPAVEYADGTKAWWVNGDLHRDNGLPAVEWSDGSKSWWVNGKRIYSWDEYQQETNCSKEELVMYKLTHGDIS